MDTSESPERWNEPILEHDLSRAQPPGTDSRLEMTQYQPTNYLLTYLSLLNIILLFAVSG